MLGFMHLTRNQPVRWSLLALSVGAAAWFGHVISFPFQTASSMATAHVMGPIYALMVVATGGAAMLAAEWLVRRLR